MKCIITLCLVSAAVSHCKISSTSRAGLTRVDTYPNLIVNGRETKEWEFVRMTANHYNNGPIDNPSSAAIRCYEDPSRKPAGVANVTAGSSIGFKASNTQGHPGPVGSH
jgi:hypothetical protein